MPPELRSAKTILLHPPLRSDERQSSAIEAKKGPCSPKQEPFSFSCPADEMIQQSETHSLYYLSGYPQVDLSVSPRHGSISSATGRHWPRANTISDSRWNRSRCGTGLCVGRVSVWDGSRCGTSLGVGRVSVWNRSLCGTGLGVGRVSVWDGSPGPSNPANYLSAPPAPPDPTTSIPAQLRHRQLLTPSSNLYTARER